MTPLEGIGLLLLGLTVWLVYRQARFIQASLSASRLEALVAAIQALLGTFPPSREALLSALERLAVALQAPAVEVTFAQLEAFPGHVRWPELHSALPDPLILPLQISGQRLGELRLAAKRQGYSPEERNLLAQFADALADFALSTQLQIEVSERRDELEVLVKLSATLNEAQEPQRVFQVITRVVLDLTTAGDAHILLWDKREQVLSVVASAWRNEPRVEALKIRPHGLAMQVARLGEAVFIDDALNHPLHADGSAERFGITARAALPLRHNEQVFGVIIAARYQPGAFTYREKRLLTAMADQAALAVHNAQLLDDAKSRAEELESLLEVAAELTSTRRPEHTLRVITEAALDLCEVEVAHIFLWHGVQSGLELAASSYREAGSQDPAVDPFSQEVARSAQARFVTTRLGEGDLLAMASLPLRHEGEVLGVLTVKRRSAVSFSSADERILRGLADYGALAIQNARSHQELEALSELKSDFIATASHELKTPLMSLLGFAELLADHPLDETTLHYAVRAIQSEVDRMDEIIETLLNSERVRRELLKPPPPADIVPVLQQCYEKLQASAELSSIEVALEIPQGFPLALLHADQFALIVNNLFSNALKYSPKGAAVRVTLYQEGSNGVLTVQDTGVGIAPEELSRLFVRFYRVRKDPQVQRTRGTGLGLAIARETARRYGGDLFVSSDGLGAGSRFTLIFPLVVAPLGAA